MDLAVDVQNCLGDSDALSCYMLPLSAGFLALPFATGGGSLDNIVRQADEVGTGGLLSAGTVVEYGAGVEFANMSILKKMYPGADIVLTESEVAIQLAKRRGAYDEATQAGARIVENYHRLPDEGIHPVVSVAIAPQPSQAMVMAETMVDVTLPGGRIYIAARHGESTARWMANVFFRHYGIEDVMPRTIFRNQIPFKSSYLDAQVDVIDFVVPR